MDDTFLTGKKYTLACMVHACILYERAKGILNNLLSQEAVRADHISLSLHH